MLFSSGFHGLQAIRVELPARISETEENRIKNFSTFRTGGFQSVSAVSQIFRGHCTSSIDGTTNY